MNQEEFVWRKQVTIASSVSTAAELIGSVIEQLKKHDWGEKKVFAIHLALEEAMMNAIKHGNQGDESKSIATQFELTASRFCARITDEGSGFKISEVPDPTKEENLELPSGRGLAMIQNYIDEFHYSEQSNSLMMVIHRDKQEQRRGQ
ncbi:MAG: ATP-binding protein [Planctomycetota bacterium]|nr:ATP-binding protein [Planctomycetota bacterium]